MKKILSLLTIAMLAIGIPTAHAQDFDLVDFVNWQTEDLNIRESIEVQIPGENPWHDVESKDEAPILSMEFSDTGNWVVSLRRSIMLDPTRTYRLDVVVYLEGDAYRCLIGGYAYMGQGTHPLLIPGDERKGAWAYYVKMNLEQGINQDAFVGWHPMNATLGPEGSGADFVIPQDTDRLGLTFRVSTSGPAKLYLKDLSITEISD